MIDYNTLLDQLTGEISEIPSTKKYWLIRTQSGSLYESFTENGFVGIDRSELSLKELAKLRTAHPDKEKFLEEIKKSIKKFYDARPEDEISPQKIGLNSGQIYKFYSLLKEGDTVVVPSADSRHVYFGIVKESFIAEFSDEERRKFDDISVPFLSKRVKWLKEFSRYSLDPNIFKMFTAHQAITNVTKYAEIIERTLRDVYVLENQAHLIINVAQKEEIKAKNLFGMGYSLLELVDILAEDLGLEGISSEDLEVTVNLNSPGKIDLKSGIKKTVIFAGLIVLVCGGGYTTSSGASLKTEGLKSLIEAIADFQDRADEREGRKEDREFKRMMFKRYEDSLHVKTPEDMVRLMKQVDTNKDLAK